MTHWVEQYIGRPYILGEADCARLLSDVRREVFNLPVPSEVEVDRVASRLGRVGQMTDLVAEYGKWTNKPAEGDAVLMICMGRPSHIGVYCYVDGRHCVLHSMENAKMVVLHKISDLNKYLLSVEGYYKWK